jgi:hypothetical protein
MKIIFLTDIHILLLCYAQCQISFLWSLLLLALRAPNYVLAEHTVGDEDLEIVIGFNVLF